MLTRSLALGGLLTLLAACGSPAPAGTAADLLVLTSDFGAGSFTVQDVGGAWRLDAGEGLVGADAAARSFPGWPATVWLLDRGTTHTVKSVSVVGAASVTGTWDTGPASNPHDIWVSGQTAWVTLYDAPHLLVLDVSGGQDEEIDLAGHPGIAACAAPEGLPEADQVFMKGGMLFVTLQCLDRVTDPWNWAPATTGKIAVVHPGSGAVTAVHDLPGCLNPHDAAEGPGGTHLFISCTGAYDGGVDGALVTYSYADGTVSTLATEAEFGGGDILGLAVGAAGEAFVIVADTLGGWETRVDRWDPVTGAISTVHAPGDGFWHNRLAVKRGLLWMAGGSPWTATAGVVRLDAGTLAVVDPAPITTGLPPQVLVWVGDPYFGGGGH